ncbi:MAG: hypothetical protein HJJLKODD_00139 [Phycisphaerae bacterium]|nr:hypothetical protein [Phycisphaerae bacterium]
MSPESHDQIQVKCTCGTILNMPISAAGRRARCPKCQVIFTIPQPPNPEEDEFNLVEELADEEQTVISGPTGSSARLCPRCQQPMKAGQQLCVQCGFYLPSEQQYQPESQLKSQLTGAVRNVSATVGPFMLGCLYSGAGALIGATIWCIIAIALKLEIGYVAWGLGVLAGIGMAKGYRNHNFRAGVVASIVAILGIVGAKAMVFIYVNYPEIKEARQAINALGDEHTIKRYQITSHYIEQQAMQQGLSPSDSRRDLLGEQQFQKALLMSPAELDTELARIKAWEESGRWAEPNYPRNFLIYARLGQEMEKYYEQFEDGADEEDIPPFSQAQWSTLYQQAAAEIDALTPEQQLQQARQKDKEIKRDESIFRLAQHQAELRTMEQGLQQYGDQHAQLMDEEKKRLQKLADTELASRVAKLDEWEAGAKWDDFAYTRHYLIYSRVEEAMSTWDENQEFDENYEARYDAEWKRQYDLIVVEVDQLAPGQIRELVRKNEEENQRRLATFSTDFQADATKEVASEAFDVFIKNYFSLFDILWVIFAVGSAFQIAAGGAVNES